MEPPRPDDFVAQERPALSTVEVLAVFFAAFGFGLYTSFLIRAIGLGGTAEQVIGGALYEGSQAGAVIWWLKASGRGTVRSLGWPQEIWGDVGFGFLIGIAGLVASGVVSSIALQIYRQVTGHQPTFPNATDTLHGGWLVPGVILITVVAPICEEIVFRGFLFRGLRSRFSFWASAIGSAGLFALAHIYLVRIPGIFVDGILLAALYDKRRSLLATICAHATVNITVVAVYLASR